MGEGRLKEEKNASQVYDNNFYISMEWLLAAFFAISLPDIAPKFHGLIIIKSPASSFFFISRKIYIFSARYFTIRYFVKYLTSAGKMTCRIWELQPHPSEMAICLIHILNFIIKFLLCLTHQQNNWWKFLNLWDYTNNGKHSRHSATVTIQKYTHTRRSRIFIATLKSNYTIWPITNHIWVALMTDVIVE